MFFLFQFLLAFSRTTVYVHNRLINIDINNQVAWVSSNQIFAIQFKGIIREKCKMFVLKVATSGPHLITL